jgi:hypothetical protein
LPVHISVGTTAARSEFRGRDQYTCNCSNFILLRLRIHIYPRADVIAVGWRLPGPSKDLQYEARRSIWLSLVSSAILDDWFAGILAGFESTKASANVTPSPFRRFVRTLGNGTSSQSENAFCSSQGWIGCAQLARCVLFICVCNNNRANVHVYSFCMFSSFSS